VTHRASGTDRPFRALLSCECSGRVRREIAKFGWQAWSADILPAEDAERIKDSPLEHHYQGDVLDLFDWNHPYNADRLRLAGSHYWSHGQCDSCIPLWDLAIGFPPCTHLAYAGACWFPQKIADGRQAAAMKFFMQNVYAPSPLVAVENPRGVPMKQYRQPDQKIQPWMWGQNFKKTTCLWLTGLPLLVPAVTEEPEDLAIVVSGGSRAGGAKWREEWNKYEDGEGRANRAKVRSRTFEGIAAAMASQWVPFAEEYYG
jgi:hypothetical protein